MEQNQGAKPRIKKSLTRSVQWLRQLPFKWQIVLAIFLVAAVALAFRTAFSGRDSSLHLRLQHGYRTAQLTVLIDGRRAYAGKLTGYPKKKYVVIGETVEGSLSQIFPVTSGTHEVLVRVEPGDGTIQEETISGVFGSNTERDLSVSARRSGITMSWKGDSSMDVAKAESAPANDAGPSWFSRYAGSLFLTAAGSIVSAITGLAFKELPGYLKSRQDATKASPDIGTQS